jgi:transcriptional regulator with XRE-family HTH domain
MTATLKPEQRETLEQVEEGFAQWQGKLENAAEQGAIDPELLDRLSETLRQLIVAANEGLVPPLDAETSNELRRRLLKLVTIDAGDRRAPLDIADEALMEAEAVRHIVRDVLEGRPAAGTSTQDQVRQLDEWLPRISVTHMARLLGVDRRTVTRMRSDEDPPPPRLELVWRLVALLHRSWTDEGVVAWFERPRTELDGRAPLEVLGDHSYEQELTDLARRGRTQRAS